MFPETRLRRFRLNENIRSMVRESRVHADQLIYPIFGNLLALTFSLTYLTLQL